MRLILNPVEIVPLYSVFSALAPILFEVIWPLTPVSSVISHQKEYKQSP